MDVVFYPSGHGFGHLTRSLEVARALHDANTELRIHVRAPFSIEAVRDALGFEPASHEEVRLDIGLVQLDSLHHDLEASLDVLTRFFDHGEELIESEAAWMKRAGIRAALIDIPPHAFAAAERAGVPAFGFGNFSWSSIWQEIATRQPAFSRFVDQAQGWYSGAKVFFAAGMTLGMEDFPVVEHVPLISRRSNKSASEVRGALNLDNDPRPMLLLAFGGEGLATAPVIDPEVLERYLLVATPPLPEDLTGVHYLTSETLAEQGLRYNDLVRAADVALVKPGYSTVSECAGNETALLVVPRDGFAESDVLIDWIRQHMPHALLPLDDFQRGHWSAALAKLEAKKPYRFDGYGTDGAEVIAQRVLEMITAD